MRRALFACLALLALAAPPVAHADAFDQILKDFRKDGRIDPCAHTQRELESAMDQIPPDIEQYAPDLPDELSQAIETRAKRGCDNGGGAAAPGNQPGAA